MAEFVSPTDEQRGLWAAWVASRPARVREVIERHGLTPWKIYRLTATGHRVTLYALDEPHDGGPVTVKVNVTGEFNIVAFDRSVFGVKPEELVECDLPAPWELVGSAGMTPEQAREAMERLEKTRS